MSAKREAIKSEDTARIFSKAEPFSSFSVNNLNQAKDFYGRTLGLKVAEQSEGLELNLPDGNSIFVYPKANHQPASFTILNFKVDDIRQATSALKNKGIRIEEYNLPNLKTGPDGIMSGTDMEVAWFKDPAGNILSVIEEK